MSPQLPQTAEPDTRTRRLSGEWALLKRLAELNPEVISELEWRRDVVADIFAFRLDATPGWESPEATRVLHHTRFCFPRFFPAMPLECFVNSPTFHPNIHPLTGNVCLWDRYSETETVLDAVRRLRSVLSGHSFNGSADHVMRPEALEKYLASKPSLPLHPLRLPQDWLYDRAVGAKPAQHRRKRLERYER